MVGGNGYEQLQPTRLNLISLTKQFARLPELNCFFTENHLLKKIKSEGYKQRTELRFLAALKGAPSLQNDLRSAAADFHGGRWGSKKAKRPPAG
jgi:hypothetical protein